MKPQTTIDIDGQFQQASAAHRRGQLAQAQAACEKILSLQPGHFDALLLLGIIACQTRNAHRGIDFIGRAIAVNPLSAAAHCNIGNAYKGLKRLQEALASYDRAIELRPDFAEAYYNRGNALLDLNRADEALASYDRAIAVGPDFAEVHCNRGNAMLKLCRGDEALASYDRAIVIKPGHATAHSGRANALSALGRLDEALASYDRAIEIKPDFADAYYNRSNTLSDLARFDEALASYDRAIDLKPDFPEAYCNRGNTLSALGRLQEAAASHAHVVALEPESARARIDLGGALMQLGKFEEALANFMRAFQIDPGVPGGLSYFSALLSDVGISAAPKEIRKLIIRCFESSEIESATVGYASTILLLGDLEQYLRADAADPASVSELDSLTEGLLIAHLMSCFIVDPRLETGLAGVRTRLLRISDDADRTASQPDDDLRFLIALAHQGFLNEYIWDVTNEEQDRVMRLEASIIESVTNGIAPAIRDLFLLAAYRPLHQVAEIRSWCLASLSEFQGQVRRSLSHLVANPAKEAELAAEVEQVTSIDDPISVAVRSQYEENPYPRWDGITVGKPVHYITRILREIAPNRPDLKANCKNPRILIAGCGSGKHPLESSLGTAGCEVLAIDLSRASLAYAKRKAVELGVTGVRFVQADILNVQGLGGQYDVVESVGVLHHMAEPEAGLGALLGVLKPGGFIKLGLYSELARQHIVRLRNLVGNTELALDRDRIRKLRRALIEAGTPDLRVIQGSPDFYSTSTVRDLLFHAYERRFSALQIGGLIDEFRLEFLGFQFASPRIKLGYAKRFPDDPACINLENWQRFETENPHVFSEMYVFWCRKRIEDPAN